MKKRIYTIAALLAGVMIIGSVSALARTAELEGKAYWNNKAKILFDDNTRILTDDYLIINYKDYNYTSARFIAEGLGAKVDYDEKERTIKITSPTYGPVYEEINVEDAYLEAPMKYEDERLGLTVHGITLEYPAAIYFSVDSVDYSKGSVTLEYDKAYLEYEDKKYPIRYDYSGFFEQDLLSVKEGRLVFDRIDEGTSDEVKIVIPYFESKNSKYYGTTVELLLKLPKIEVDK